MKVRKMTITFLGLIQVATELWEMIREAFQMPWTIIPCLIGTPKLTIQNQTQSPPHSRNVRFHQLTTVVTRGHGPLIFVRSPLFWTIFGFWILKFIQIKSSEFNGTKSLKRALYNLYETNNKSNLFCWNALGFLSRLTTNIVAVGTNNLQDFVSIWLTETQVKLIEKVLV